MTYTEREQMFSKEVLTNEDIQKLFGVDAAGASRIITEIKFKSNRLNIRGKVHIQDYLDAYNLKEQRYQKQI